jgi:hypothetical protein
VGYTSGVGSTNTVCENMSAVGTADICSLTPLIFSELFRPLLSVLGNHVRREVVISSHLLSSPRLMTPLAASTEFTKQDLPSSQIRHACQDAEPDPLRR